MSKTGTREWSDESYNLEAWDGKCPNRCAYCYAGEYSRRYGRTPRQKPIGKYKDLMAFTRHDITPDNLDEASRVLIGLAEAGNKLLIVTKANLDCVKTLCASLEPWKGQVEWRITIGGFMETCAAWEPGAPAMNERVLALAHAQAAGYQTSVSMEPILEPSVARTVNLYLALKPYCTGDIWLGLMNRAEARVRMNGGTPGQIEMARKLDAYWHDRECAHVHDLHAALANEPKARWKDSITKILRLA